MLRHARGPVTLVLVLASVAVGHAIPNGQPDGNQHPYVGDTREFGATMLINLNGLGAPSGIVARFAYRIDQQDDLDFLATFGIAPQDGYPSHEPPPECRESRP